MAVPKLGQLFPVLEHFLINKLKYALFPAHFNGMAFDIY
jgi:hypothetical protein